MVGGNPKRHLIALGALCLCGAYFGWIVAIRGGEISFVSPFCYTGIVVSIVLGMLVWATMPTPVMLSGVAMIIGSGVYIFHTATGARRRRSQAADTSAPAGRTRR